MKNRRPYNRERKFFRITDELFLSHIYGNGGVLINPPKEIVPFLEIEEPIVFASYEGTRVYKQKVRESVREVHKAIKDKCLVSYLLKTTEQQLNAACAKRYKKAVIIDVRETSEDPKTDDDYNIFSKHTIPENLEEKVINAIRRDIKLFCDEPAKERKEGKHHERVDRIEVSPKFVPRASHLDELAKAGKGTYGNICPIKIGTDIMRGCISAITPEGRFDLRKRCLECYAHQNVIPALDTILLFNKDTYLRRINKKIEKLGLKEEKVVYIRLGQRTEINIPPVLRILPGYIDNLKIVLTALAELAQQRDTRVAMPTKIPDFDDETIDLFKKANVTVLPSSGIEKFHEGITDLGYPLKVRLEKALELAQRGVKTVVYPMVDITRGEESMYEDSVRATEFYFKHENDFAGLQYLDGRITNKDLAEMMGGGPWNQLRYCLPRESKQGHFQQDLFLEEGRFYLTGQTYLTARITHPYWLKIIGDNKGKIRLCSTHVKDGNRKCGKCFMDK